MSQTHSTETAPQLFDGMIESTVNEKALKNARIWLYVICGLQVLMGIYEYATTSDQYIAIAAFVIDAMIGSFFLGLALWSRKKPVAAFTTALVAYVVVHIGFGLLEPANILKGILIKIIVVVALVKAVKEARKYEDLKSSLGEEEQMVDVPAAPAEAVSS